MRKTSSCGMVASLRNFLNTRVGHLAARTLHVYNFIKWVDQSIGFEKEKKNRISTYEENGSVVLLSEIKRTKNFTTFANTRLWCV